MIFLIVMLSRIRNGDRNDRWLLGILCPGFLQVRMSLEEVRGKDFIEILQSEVTASPHTLGVEGEGLQRPAPEIIYIYVYLISNPKFRIPKYSIQNPL